MTAFGHGDLRLAPSIEGAVREVRWRRSPGDISHSMVLTVISFFCLRRIRDRFAIAWFFLTSCWAAPCIVVLSRWAADHWISPMNVVNSKQSCVFLLESRGCLLAQLAFLFDSASGVMTMFCNLIAIFPKMMTAATCSLEFSVMFLSLDSRRILDQKHNDDGQNF